MTEIAARIMSIAKDNTMVAIVLTGISSGKMNLALEKLEQHCVTREMIICFWTHVCNRDRTRFDDYVLSLTDRPSGCPSGCLWEPVKVDESKIFGPAEKECFRDCAMVECENPSKYYCSHCYCVRYCSPLCQRLDHPRHKNECRQTVEAVILLKSRGEVYAKRIIKNNISISDAAWTRLWEKHGLGKQKINHSPSLTNKICIHSDTWPHIHSDAQLRTHSNANPKAIAVRDTTSRDIPRDIWKIILEYEAPTALLPWIPADNINWPGLSGNSCDAAIELLKKHPDKINYYWLSTNSNPEAIELLKKHPDKINWAWLSENSCDAAFELLKEHSDKIDYNWLSGNSNLAAIELLEKHPDEINWALLSGNSSDAAIELLKKHPDKINWTYLSTNSNPEAIELLKKHPDKIDWTWLSENSNPAAIELLKKHPDKINWPFLSGNSNPAAIELLKEHSDKIDYNWLSGNSNLAAIELLKKHPDKINWVSLSRNSNPDAIELLKKHPDKIDYYRLSGNLVIFQPQVRYAVLDIVFGTINEN